MKKNSAIMRTQYKEFGTDITFVGQEQESYDGFATTFFNEDRTGDVMLPSVKESLPTKVPFLLNHDRGDVIGVCNIVSDDNPQGVRIRAELNKSDPEFEKYKSLIDMGALTGLSVGFIPIKYTEVEKDGWPSFIYEEIDLMEVSLTPTPCNSQAHLFQKGLTLPLEVENYSIEDKEDKVMEVKETKDIAAATVEKTVVEKPVEKAVDDSVVKSIETLDRTAEKLEKAITGFVDLVEVEAAKAAPPMVPGIMTGDPAVLEKAFTDAMFAMGSSNVTETLKSITIDQPKDVWGILFGDYLFKPKGILATFNKVGVDFLEVFRESNPDADGAQTHTDGTDKVEQSLVFGTRTIESKFVYKLQSISKYLERRVGSFALAQYIVRELYDRVMGHVEKLAIIGAEAESPFQPIATDAWTQTFQKAADQYWYDVILAAKMAIRTDGPKYMVAKASVLTELMTARDTNGQLTNPIANPAAIFGLSGVFTPQWMDSAQYPVIIYDGNEYALVGDTSPSSYNNFILRKNETEYLCEVFAGGALKSTFAASRVALLP